MRFDAAIKTTPTPTDAPMTDFSKVKPQLTVTVVNKTSSDLTAPLGGLPLTKWIEPPPAIPAGKSGSFTAQGEGGVVASFVIYIAETDSQKLTIKCFFNMHPPGVGPPTGLNCDSGEGIQIDFQVVKQDGDESHVQLTVTGEFAS